ncbi:hypothetical protein NDU88_005878 [Pleurodeles waltl]|uniref:Uncharacterized protein n=1 Tax=Pleurodeles waltl TaxID=8319 RepID=A0AAV7LAL9_PLEWA|nr:hypothetical protein NDU88_005878 [Pleurodeles waltl]
MVTALMILVPKQRQLMSHVLTRCTRVRLKGSVNNAEAAAAHSGAQSGAVWGVFPVRLLAFRVPEITASVSLCTIYKHTKWWEFVCNKRRARTTRRAQGTEDEDLYTNWESVKAPKHQRDLLRPIRDPLPRWQCAGTGQWQRRRRDSRVRDGPDPGAAGAQRQEARLGVKVSVMPGFPLSVCNTYFLNINKGSRGSTLRCCESTSQARQGCHKTPPPGTLLPASPYFSWHTDEMLPGAGTVPGSAALRTRPHARESERLSGLPTCPVIRGAAWTSADQMVLRGRGRNMDRRWNIASRFKGATFTTRRNTSIHYQKRSRQKRAKALCFTKAFIVF